jgi:hypothetical protein
VKEKESGTPNHIGRTAWIASALARLAMTEGNRHCEPKAKHSGGNEELIGFMESII